MTPAQVAAAKLVLKLDREDGREPDPLAVKIANAKQMDREKFEAEQAAKRRQAEVSADD
ncbi:MAG TPA: hypothetical protein VGJ44_04285 [Kribbellaceae bacterium]